MQTDQPVAMFQRQGGRDARPPIATERDEPGIPQTVHELGPRSSYSVNVPPRCGWGVAETVTGQRRNNDVECRFERRAERRWIGQPLHHLLELEERAGPPVSHDQRNGMGDR
jgi:hypothetical protein